MKRTVSLVLAAALVLGSIPAGFAATAGETLKGYGVVAGDTNGNLNEDKTITRAEMMTVLARLLGKFEEASKYSIPSTSKDVAGHWNANVIAFAEKEGWTAGKGNGMFDPQGVVTLQETAAFMLKALGYTITDYAKVVEEATAKGLLKDVVAKELTAPVKRSDVFASALNTLNTPSKDATVKLGEKLGYFKSEALTVGEIKANAANSFQVKFNKAVDPTKVAFAVKRESTAATVTTTWNTEKTMATLTYASKLPEGNYEVTVNDTTTADKPVVMATQKLVIEKEKIAKVEVASETLLRYSETKGYVPYKLFNQYGEDVTNGMLGRTVNIISTLGGDGTAELKRDSGIAIFSYGTTNGSVTKLRNLPSVVFTIQDTSVGFVFTKTLKVSETANAIAEVKINGIVNEKGEKVDFVWNLAKAYYLDLTVLDTNGQEIKSTDVLGAEDNNVKVLQVRTSNATNIQGGGILDMVQAPGKTDVAAWRISLNSASAPTFDTPVVFTAIAPFGTSGKNNATFTTTLKRAARVEKFTLLAPSEIASQNRDVELFFEAFDQNGEKVTAYDDLKVVNFTPNDVTGTVKLVRQADGTAKLIANFTNKQLYYVTATVPNSLTGAFSQVSIDVKETSDKAKIDALAHAKLYTPNAAWTVGSDKFVIKDKYNRVLNLKTDTDATQYAVKVSVEQGNVLELGGNLTVSTETDANGKVYDYVLVTPGDEFKFIGGTDAGTAVVNYTLVDTRLATNDLNYVQSRSSAVAYNIATKDVKSITLSPSADPTYMTSKDTTAKFYTGGANTALGDAQYRDVVVNGKTKDGADVRITGVKYKTTHPGFDASTNKFKAKGEFGTAVTATTVASAEYNNGLDVLTATATVNASAEKPVASAVSVDYNPLLKRNGTIKFSNNVLTVSAAVFNSLISGKSFFSYTSAGAEVTAQTPVYFNAESQYGDYTLDKLTVIPLVRTGSTTVSTTPTVDAANGIMTVTAVEGDQYSVTASTENGKKAVITIIVEGLGNTTTIDLNAAKTAVKAYEDMPESTPAEIDALILGASNASAAAQIAINKVTNVTEKNALQVRLIAADNATQALAAAITNVVTKAAATTAVVADYAAIKITVDVADIADVNTAVAAAAAGDKDTAVEIKTIVDATVASKAAAAATAAAAVVAAENAVATVESYKALAIATTTKANLDAFKSVYTNADTKVQALPNGTVKTDLGNRLTAAKSAVVADADFTFVVTKADADATHIKVVVAGTAVTNLTGMNVAGLVLTNGTTPAINASTLEVTTAGNATAATAIVATITDAFWAKSDTVTINVANGTTTVTVSND